MVKLKPAFAELLLPLAFQDLALHPAVTADTSAKVAAAIETKLLPCCPAEPKAMRLLLRCLNHLRSLYLDARMKGKASVALLNPRQASAWPKVYWVDLDYLKLSSAALRCKAYFSALLYAEAWCEAVGKGRLVIPAHKVPGRAELDSLLLEVYSTIEEPDGLYAVARSNDLLPQLRRFEREGDWAQALATCDLALQLMDEQGANGSSRQGISRAAAQAGILRCLANMGASNVMAGAAQGWRPAGGGANAVELGQWTPLDPGNREPDPTDAYLSSGVAALVAGSAERCNQALTSARRALVGALATAGLESSSDVNPALVRLQMLQEIGEAWDLKWPDMPNLGSVGSPSKPRRGSSGSLRTANGSQPPHEVEAQPGFEQALAQWRAREAVAGEQGRYSLLAPLQDLRRELLKTLNAPAAEVECLTQSAVAARKSGHYGQASGMIFRLRSLIQRANVGAAGGRVAALAAPTAPWRVEEAKVLWARGQKEAAIATAQGLIAMRVQGRASGGPSSDAYLQTLVAKWMSITQSESSAKIVDMLRRAAKAENGAEAMGDVTARCRIFYRLAWYADRLHRGIQEQMASPDWKTAQDVIQTKVKECQSIAQKHTQKAGGSTDADKNQLKQWQFQMINLQKVIDQDTKESKAVEERSSMMRELALFAYRLCLLAGDKYDLPATFRPVQIWLSMMATDSDEKAAADSVNKVMRAIFQDVPSRKLLPLVYQVASRLSGEQCSFQQTLKELLVRLGTEHPFHCLLQIMALKNGNRDKDGNPVAPSAKHKGLAYVADPEKVAAATRVLDYVAAANERSRTIVSELEVATDGYIHLAAIPVAREQMEMPFPSAFRRQLT